MDRNLPSDHVVSSGHAQARERQGAGHGAGETLGFFTDTTLCIGCKACEVACKQWNQLPDDGFAFTGMSYDNTGHLGASTWRHVAFVEREGPLPGQGSPRDGVPSPAPLRGAVEFRGQVPSPAPLRGAVEFRGHVPAATQPFAELFPAGQPGPTSLLKDIAPSRIETPVPLGPTERALGQFAWLMLSDVCKHCERAGCLEACPTGAIIRTEFGSVYVQPDVCNGCGYCVSACPFGVVDRREDDGRAWKCSLCYDRLKGGMVPACAKACPTASIQFGELSELRVRARQRVEQLHARGVGDAYLYGEDAVSQPGTEGLHAFFLLCDEPAAYNLPPDPVVPTAKIVRSWWSMAAGVLSLAALAVGSAFSARRA